MSDAEIIMLFVVAGAVLSLNPTNIAIFSGLLAGSLGKGHHKMQQHVVAVTFLLTTFCLYAIVGSVLILFLDLLSLRALQNIGLVTGFVCTVWGIVNIKSYYWYGKHRDVSVRLAKILHTRTVKKNDPTSAALLGITAGYAALPSIGVPMLAFSVIFSLIKPGVANIMLILAFILILPLIVIFALSLQKLKLSSVLKWKEDSKGVFRLSIGLTTIVFGWILFLILNGSMGIEL